MEPNLSENSHFCWTKGKDAAQENSHFCWTKGKDAAHPPQRKGRFSEGVNGVGDSSSSVNWMRAGQSIPFHLESMFGTEQTRNIFWSCKRGSRRLQGELGGSEEGDNLMAT